MPVWLVQLALMARYATRDVKDIVMGSFASNLLMVCFVPTAVTMVTMATPAN